MVDKCLIDTDILLAAYTNIDLENKDIAKSLILWLHSGHKVYISIQNYQEFIMMINKLNIIERKKIEMIIKNIQEIFDLIYFDKTTISDALNLSFEKKISYYDALLLQTMLDNKITTIYSFHNTSLKNIKGIKAISPKTIKRLNKK